MSDQHTCALCSKLKAEMKCVACVGAYHAGCLLDRLLSQLEPTCPLCQNPLRLRGYPLIEEYRSFVFSRANQSITSTNIPNAPSRSEPSQPYVNRQPNVLDHIGSALQNLGPAIQQNFGPAMQNLGPAMQNLGRDFLGPHMKGLSTQISRSSLVQQARLSSWLHQFPYRAPTDKHLLGGKVIAVMVQRYGILPKEMWDLNSTSDMGAGRGLKCDERISKALFESIVGNGRYRIVTLTVEKGARDVSPPATLQRLHILAHEYDDPLVLPETLQELIFYHSCVYNQPLRLPGNLRKLKLGFRYAQPLTFPPALVDLGLGQYYTEPLVLPPRLKRLAFNWGSQFDLPVPLPESRVSVRFGDIYNQPTVLPNGIEEIRIGMRFSQDLWLPNSVRKLEWRCNRPVQLPARLSEVVFDDVFDQPVVLPPGLKKATFGMTRYSHRVNFPEALQELEWCPSEDNGGLVLPRALRKLVWASNDSVRLPGLKELRLTDASHAPVLVLPQGLLEFTFDSSCPRHYDLPKSVAKVTCSGYLTFTHPSTLQHLIVKHNNEHEALNLSDHKVHKLTLGDSFVRIWKWPQGLKELEFKSRTYMGNSFQVPIGCVIVGKNWPANVSMEGAHLSYPEYTRGSYRTVAYGTVNSEDASDDSNDSD